MKHTHSSSDGPLAGYTIVELAGIGPCPFAGQMLADLGADVILVDRPGLHLPFVEKRGKRSIVVDLRKDGAPEIVLRLVDGADALIEGLRPGVAERLGVGPVDCHARNGALVYGRMTGWGQTGPWANMAGHDINYLSITGALAAIGNQDEPPTVPLNLIGDYGGGSMFLAMGVLAGMLRAQKTGKGDVVDAAIIDGVGALMGILHSLNAVGQWQPGRAQNMLDGGAPYYRCYETADHLYMAVGAIEAQFFAQLLSLLEIDADAFGAQNDRSHWPAQHRALEAKFKTRTRAQWSALFDGKDACVTPVLDYFEAAEHPHNKDRHTHYKRGNLCHPASAPRFANHHSIQNPGDLRVKGMDTRDILGALSYSADDIDRMLMDGMVLSA